MDKRNIDWTSISYTHIDDKKEFKHGGHLLKFVKKFDNGFYLYARYGYKGKHIGWEYVKPKIHNGIPTYPGSSDWGVWGFSYLPTIPADDIPKKHEKRLKSNKTKSNKTKS